MPAIGKKWKGDTLIPQEINFDTNVEDILSDIKKAKIEDDWKDQF